jgi:hypothetical protein
MTRVKPLEKVEEVEDREGQIQDFVSGHWVKAGPEEVGAVQIFARRLVEDYGYEKNRFKPVPNTVSASARRTRKSRTRRYRGLQFVQEDRG